MWTPLKVEGRGVWTSAHPAGGGRGRAGMGEVAGGIKAAQGLGKHIPKRLGYGTLSEE